jgi:GxxExxY protein
MKIILKCCFELKNALGTGFLESIYKNSLLIAMTDSGSKGSTERGFEVFFMKGRWGYLFLISSWS